MIVAANNTDSSFQDTALSIIKKIMRENNVKTEDELRELLDNPTDNVRHFLFNYDLLCILWQMLSIKFETILERLGFDSEDEFNQMKNIYFDTVIMDEASKATPPDLVLPLCFGRKSIVIGDHRQLPPMLNEQDFKEALLTLNDEKATALANDIDRQFVDTSQFARLILNPLSLYLQSSTVCILRLTMLSSSSTRTMKAVCHVDWIWQRLTVLIFQSQRADTTASIIQDSSLLMSMSFG